MSPTVAELLKALPAESVEEVRSESAQLDRVLTELSQRPVPTGALHRLWKLGGLQARVGMAYLAYWAKSWFQTPDARRFSSCSIKRIAVSQFELIHGFQLFGARPF